MYQYMDFMCLCLYAELLSQEQGTFLLDIFTKLAQTQSHSSPLFARAKSLSSPQTEVHATLSTGMEIGFSAEIDDDVGAECRRLCAYNMPVSNRDYSKPFTHKFLTYWYCPKFVYE